MFAVPLLTLVVNVESLTVPSLSLEDKASVTVPLISRSASPILLGLPDTLILAVGAALSDKVMAMVLLL